MILIKKKLYISIRFSRKAYFWLIDGRWFGGGEGGWFEVLLKSAEVVVV